MANEEHLARLKQDVAAWNRWRSVQDHRWLLEGQDQIKPDLVGANLAGANLAEADLTRVFLPRANLIRANLAGANLLGADLTEANLKGANLAGADLTAAFLVRATLHYADLAGAKLAGAFLAQVRLHNANLTGANLARADLHTAVLIEANLTEANLAGANLMGAHLGNANFFKASLRAANIMGALLLGTNCEQADLTGCFVHGISAWEVRLAGAKQADLVITPLGQPRITVDNVEVAQFIYLLLHNEKIRQVIDTITSKVVLILGRFNPPERKAVLDAIREELRRRNYLPILFDFERPTHRDFTETIMTLAGMCRFIIADITNPKSSPLELQATIPNYMVPFVPIIHEGEQPFSMFEDLKNKHSDWVLDVLAYDSPSSLVRRLENAVIRPALKKHDELRVKKAQELQIRHLKDYPDDEELV